ncbi:MAG: hypothetical protein WA196_06365 [Pseudolabrys sp.]
MASLPWRSSKVFTARHLIAAKTPIGRDYSFVGATLTGTGLL